MSNRLALEINYRTSRQILHPLGPSTGDWDQALQPALQYKQHKTRTTRYLLATVKTASVAAMALSFSPNVMTGLKASGFSEDVNLLSDTTSESIT